MLEKNDKTRYIVKHPKKDFVTDVFCGFCFIEHKVLHACDTIEEDRSRCLLPN